MQKFKFIIASSFLTFFLFSCQSFKKVTAQAVQGKVTETFESEKSKKGALLPEFSYKDADGNIKWSSKFKKNQPTLLVLFNPGCGHCKIVAGAVRDSIEMFKNTNIIFLCGGDLQEHLKGFISEMKIDSLPNFMIGADNSMVSNDLFEYIGVPQIMMYNKAKKLEHIYYSEATVPNMLNHLFAR